MIYHFIRAHCTKYPSIHTQIPYKSLVLLKSHIDYFLAYEEWKLTLDINTELADFGEFKNIVSVMSPEVIIPPEVESSAGLYRFLTEIIKVDYLVEAE